MTPVKRDPFGRIVNLQDRINQLFDDSMARSEELDEALSTCAWRPAVDIYDTPQGVMLEAELPGISKDNVLIELKDTVLIIQSIQKAPINLY